MLRFFNNDFEDKIFNKKIGRKLIKKASKNTKTFLEALNFSVLDTDIQIKN